MFTRRAFVKNSGLAMYGVGAAPAWLARAAFAAVLLLMTIGLRAVRLSFSAGFLATMYGLRESSECSASGVNDSIKDWISGGEWCFGDIVVTKPAAAADVEIAGLESASSGCVGSVAAKNALPSSANRWLGPIGLSSSN